VCPNGQQDASEPVKKKKKKQKNAEGVPETTKASVVEVGSPLVPRSVPET